MKRCLLLLLCLPVLAQAAPAMEGTASPQASQHAIQQKSQDADPALQQRLDDLHQRLDRLQTHSNSTPDWVDRLHFHGFATFGLTRSDLSDYPDIYYNPRAANSKDVYMGVNKDYNWRSLSRAGLQVSADLGHDTQLVTQFLARGGNNYDVRLQWAYVSHNLTPGLKIRAGRLVLPFYMHSQYHDVGFAYPWVTLPDEVYSSVPGDTADGVGLLWDITTGPVAYTFNLQWANTDIYAASLPTAAPFDAVSVSTYHVQNMVSGNVSASWQALTLRLGYSGGKVTQKGSIDNEYAYFANGGFKYDDGRFLLTGEWTQLDINGFFPRTRSSYVSAGVHFGRWLPLVTFGQVNTSTGGQTIIPSFKSGSGYNVSDYAGDKQQKRWALGLRYDLTTHLALKAEYDHIYDLEGDISNGSGLFNGPVDMSNFTPTHANLFRLSVDAVF